jgi:uncharacterized membrane protein
MRWLQERVWQMGIGVLLVLLGVVLVYTTAAAEPVNRTLMWTGLALIFTGFFIPLISHFRSRE